MFDLLKALILAIINVLLAAGPWANFTTFLGSGFVICKIGVVVSCSASVGGPMRLCLGKSLTHSRCSVNCVLSAWRWPLLGKAIYRGSSSLPAASSGISRVCYHVGASDCCNQTPLMWGWWFWPRALWKQQWLGLVRSVGQSPTISLGPSKVAREAITLSRMTTGSPLVSWETAPGTGLSACVNPPGKG